jgi:hypothetical protein
MSRSALKVIPCLLARPSSKIWRRFTKSQGLDRGLAIILRGLARNCKIANVAATFAGLGSRATVPAVNEAFKNIECMRVMNRFGANIKEVRRNRSRTIIILPNIGAVPNDPSPNMPGFLIIRSLTSSTAHMVSRHVQNMLRVRKKSFDVSSVLRSNNLPFCLRPIRKALKNGNYTTLNSAGKASIMKHNRGGIEVDLMAGGRFAGFLVRKVVANHIDLSDSRRKVFTILRMTGHPSHTE